MDNTLMESPAPLIVLASHHQFGPGEQVVQGPVASCMQLWCRHGRGSVVVNGTPCALPPGHALLLPWGRHITYFADRREPFLVSGIHVISAAGPEHAIIFGQVAHSGEIVPGHAEGIHPLSTLIHALVLDDHPALRHLSEYVIHCYGRRPVYRDMRRLAEQLLAEWAYALARSTHAEPLPLARVRRLVQDRLHLRLTRDVLARAAGVSPATLQRLTTEHLRMSPVAWAQHLRLEAATQLLVSSSLPLAEIASRFGFYDAFHFSRVFKRQTGFAPDRWRRTQTSLVPSS